MEMNSSASLMINGEIISAVSEERFSNIKMMKDTQKNQ